MRYYSISISDPKTGTTVQSYTSYQNGATLPGALNIELDIYQRNYDQVALGSFVRIWGIPLTSITQAANLIGLDITVSAGMQKGLPLANPTQAGIIAHGQIIQSIGNWVGTDMTLDLYILPFVGTNKNPVNLSFVWPSGTPLGNAIKSTLSTALPTATINVNVSPNLVIGYTESGYYGTLDQFAQWLKQRSAVIIGGSYSGVNISMINNVVSVYDGTIQSGQKMIAFNDLVGQPTWIEAPSIQVKTILRADMHVGDFITLPQGLATVTQQSAIGSPTRDKVSFQGMFQIQEVHHVGNFRQPNAEAWVSVFNASPTNQLPASTPFTPSQNGLVGGPV